MKESKKVSFYHESHYETAAPYLQVGGGEYCKYGMDNAKEAKEENDKLASYVKKNRPKGQ